MSLSAFRRGPVRLSRASGWLSKSATPADLSCCVMFPLVACHRHYPGGTDKARLFFGFADMAFPIRAVGRLPRLTFSGLARRYCALWPADLLSCRGNPLMSKALDRSLPPDRLRLRFTWSTIPPGLRVSHPRNHSHLSTTHARRASREKKGRCLACAYRAYHSSRALPRVGLFLPVA